MVGLDWLGVGKPFLCCPGLLELDFTVCEVELAAGFRLAYEAAPALVFIFFIDKSFIDFTIIAIHYQA